ncbi:hypothetical protein CQ011_04140 [Arthrobacter sp. MYb213]|nr:hypothetical protein CQ011_04140 [Arthrobacter sp. MYb213]
MSSIAELTDTTGRTFDSADKDAHVQDCELAAAKIQRNSVIAQVELHSFRLPFFVSLVVR